MLVDIDAASASKETREDVKSISNMQLTPKHRSRQSSIMQCGKPMKNKIYLKKGSKNAI